MTEDIDDAMQPTGRARPDRDQLERIKLKISEGTTTSELQEFCHNMLDLPINIRTAQRYVKQYGGNTLNIDQPVDMKNAKELAQRGVFSDYSWNNEDMYMMNLLLAELVMAVKDVGDKLAKRNKIELNKHI